MLRLVTGAQAKSPTEMLYLETAQIPVKQVISSRRLMYLHNILKQQDEELIKRIYCAMKESPMKDDWVINVEKDLNELGINLSDEEIFKLTKSQFKLIVKAKIRQHARSYKNGSLKG